MYWPTANSTGLAPSQRRGRVRLLLSTPLCSGIRWYFSASISRSLHSEWWRTSSSVSTLLIRKSRVSNGRRTHFISWRRILPNVWNWSRQGISRRKPDKGWVHLYMHKYIGIYSISCCIHINYTWQAWNNSLWVHAASAHQYRVWPSLVRPCTLPPLMEHSSCH